MSPGGRGRELVESATPGFGAVRPDGGRPGGGRHGAGRADGGRHGRTEPFLALAGRGTATVTVRGSEFIGTAEPVADADAAESFVASVREQYSDATHNVPCYRARDDDGVLREYADDDGEPTGSAGKPALNVLVQRELENVVVVVTRYYGGTELGVGGLARAYGRAVKDAVDAAGVVERRPRERFVAVVDYDDSGTVRAALESAVGADDAAFDASYGDRVSFAVTAPRESAAALRDRLRSATSGRVELRGAGEGAEGGTDEEG